MKTRNLLIIVAIVLLLLGGIGAWLVLGSGADAPPASNGEKVTATKVDDTPDAEPERRAEKAKPSVKWVRRGVGTVYGSLHEYGTERAIAGVTVKLEAGLPGPGETLETESDENGSFRFDDVTNFDAWTLRVSSPPPLADLQLAGVKVTENQDSDLGRLYLTPEFAVPGIVVSELGDPIEGATVKAVRMLPGGGGLDFLKIIRELPSEPVAVDEATTDAEGKFKLTKVPPGRYQMIVTATGFQMKLDRDVIITPDVAPLRFVMAVGFQLRGRVVRDGEGQIEGIGVVAFPEPNGLDGFTTMDKRLGVTDENGEFELDGLKGGRYMLAVTPENEPFALKTEFEIPTTDYLEIELGGE